MGYFSGKRILITGMGSGLGRRMALGMAAEGGLIIGWDVDADGLERVLAELKSATGRDHHGFVCNVADSRQVYQTADQINTQIGAPEILINNAGVVSGKRFMDCNDQEILRTMGVNAMALFWTAKAFLPEMIANNRGHMVTVASAAGLIGVSQLADYCASKYAAVGFDESLRAELRQIAPGVATTVICPFYINTGMFTGIKTRFSWLLPILEEEDAARKMITAIRRRRPRLIMPWLVYFIPFLRLLPVGVFDFTVNFLGINCSMEEFRGRCIDGEEKKGGKNDSR